MSGDDLWRRLEYGHCRLTRSFESGDCGKKRLWCACCRGWYEDGVVPAESHPVSNRYLRLLSPWFYKSANKREPVQNTKKFTVSHLQCTRCDNAQGQWEDPRVLDDAALNVISYLAKEAVLPEDCEGREKLPVASWLLFKFLAVNVFRLLCCVEMSVKNNVAWKLREVLRVFVHQHCVKGRPFECPDFFLYALPVGHKTLEFVARELHLHAPVVAECIKEALFPVGNFQTCPSDAGVHVWFPPFVLFVCHDCPLGKREWEPWLLCRSGPAPALPLFLPQSALDVCLKVGRLHVECGDVGVEAFLKLSEKDQAEVGNGYCLSDSTAWFYAVCRYAYENRLFDAETHQYLSHLKSSCREWEFSEVQQLVKTPNGLCAGYASFRRLIEERHTGLDMRVLDAVRSRICPGDCP